MIIDFYSTIEATSVCCGAQTLWTVCLSPQPHSGVSSPQLDRWHYNIKSLPPQTCCNGNSWAWSSERLWVWLGPLRKSLPVKNVYWCSAAERHISFLTVGLNGALPSPHCCIKHWRGWGTVVDRLGVWGCSCAETEEEHEKANERLMGLLLSTCLIKYYCMMVIVHK